MPAAVSAKVCAAVLSPASRPHDVPRREIVHLCAAPRQPFAGKCAPAVEQRGLKHAPAAKQIGKGHAHKVGVFIQANSPSEELSAVHILQGQ